MGTTVEACSGGKVGSGEMYIQRRLRRANTHRARLVVGEGERDGCPGAVLGGLFSRSGWWGWRRSGDALPFFGVLGDGLWKKGKGISEDLRPSSSCIAARLPAMEIRRGCRVCLMLSWAEKEICTHMWYAAVKLTDRVPAGLYLRTPFSGTPPWPSSLLQSLSMQRTRLWSPGRSFTIVRAPLASSHFVYRPEHSSLQRRQRKPLFHLVSFSTLISSHRVSVLYAQPLFQSLTTTAGYDSTVGPVFPVLLRDRSGTTSIASVVLVANVISLAIIAAIFTTIGSAAQLWYPWSMALVHRGSAAQDARMAHTYVPVQCGRLRT
jgi:hypothetical protein